MKSHCCSIVSLLFITSLMGCSGTPKQAKVNPKSNGGDQIDRPHNSVAVVTPEPTSQPTASSVEPSGNVTPVKRGGGKERGPGDPNATPAPLSFNPAGENSEYGTMMERDGTVLEVRKFANHPRLLRVELRWKDPASKAARFIFRDGTTVDISSTSIKDMASMTASSLLELTAGFAPQPSGDRPRIMNSPR